MHHSPLPRSRASSRAVATRLSGFRKQWTEHGHQFTSTRTAWNYGSSHELQLPTSNFGSLRVNDPRSAYLYALDAVLADVKNRAARDGGNLLVVVGECTKTIHDRIYSAAQQGNHRMTWFNASSGRGVNALTAYLFSLHHTTNPVIIEPTLLTFTTRSTTVEQNLFTVTYNSEKHAFAHLLNSYEDAIADELLHNGFVSVGGDLNNLTVGEALVQTINADETHMSMGSNSTGSKMYDKIVIL
jgi:hypothetical protein